MLPSSDSVAIIELCNFENWKYNKKEHEIYFGMIARNRVYSSVRNMAGDSRMPDGTYDLTDFIPVGRIRFVNSILNEIGKLPLKPINIPKELNIAEFTGRDTGEGSIQDAIDFMEKHNGAIIKSNTIVKKYEALYAKSSRDIPSDSRYFYSEIVDIDTEWRVFVHNNKIVDIRRYCGEYSNTVDIDFVNKCISTYTNSPKSYVIDIAKLKDGKYIVLEVANFVSCGLYGAADPKFIHMIINGWNHEISK